MKLRYRFLSILLTFSMLISLSGNAFPGGGIPFVSEAFASEGVEAGAVTAGASFASGKTVSSATAAAKAVKGQSAAGTEEEDGQAIEEAADPDGEVIDSEMKNAGSDSLEDAYGQEGNEDRSNSAEQGKSEDKDKDAEDDISGREKSNEADAASVSKETDKESGSSEKKDADSTDASSEKDDSAGSDASSQKDGSVDSDASSGKENAGSAGSDASSQKDDSADSGASSKKDNSSDSDASSGKKDHPETDDSSSRQDVSGGSGKNDSANKEDTGAKDRDASDASTAKEGAADENTTADETGEDGSAAEEAAVDNTSEDAGAASEDTDPTADSLTRDIPVQVEELVLYDKKGKPMESTKRVNSFWGWLFARTPLTALDRDPENYVLAPEDIIVTVSGNFPEGVTAHAGAIVFAEEAVYSETALFSLDLDMYDAQGQPYVPNGEITVTLGGRLVKDAAKKEMPLLVYDYAENPKHAEKLEEYAADVLVYRDAFGDDERLRFETGRKKDSVIFTESRNPLNVYTDNTVDFVTDTLPAHMIVSSQVTERTLRAKTADGKTKVSVHGAIAKGASAEAEAVRVQADVSDAKDSSLDKNRGGEVADTADTESVMSDPVMGAAGAVRDVVEKALGPDVTELLAVEITLTSGEEDPVSGDDTFVPDLPVTVTITDAAIREALAADGELSLWQIPEEGDPVLIEDAVFHDSSVEFISEGALSYVIFQTSLEKVLVATDGKAYRISVSYDQNAGIPTDAELAVKEIKAGDDGYDEYVAKSADALDTKPESLTLARAFDITLKDPKTGEEYQPNKDVTVTIELLNEDLGQYASIDVVHIPDGGKKQAEVMDSTLHGDSVAFETGGFSVYVLTGTNGEPVPHCVFEFHVWNDTIGAYELYGNTQKVKSGETPEIPMPASDDTREFLGWYQEVSHGVLEEEPFDFEKFAETGFTENSVIALYARFADFAYVVFYDQYDSASGIWPVAFTRRVELKEDPSTHGLSAWVQINDLTATYSGSQSMAFYGWSETPITTAGIYKNPDTSESYAISWADGDENYGKIEVTEPGKTLLYPLYRSIHYLTYYTAQSGFGAEYVPPENIFDGEGIPVLPTPTRDGYAFEGWYTGTLLTSTVDGKTVEEVSYSKQVSDRTGSLFNGTAPYLDRPDGGAFVQLGKLHISADVRLYAKWSADYNVVIWVQSPSDDPFDTTDKTYEYYDSNAYRAEIGATVSVPEECRELSINGYEFSHADGEKVIGNTRDTNVLNVYYNLTGPYSGSGDYTLTFEDSVSGSEASVMPPSIPGISYGTKLSDLSISSPADRKTDKNNTIYKFRGWYMDQACTVPADLSTMTMPAWDLTLYAGWSAEWFIVNIDPNYGAMYYYDGGNLKGTGSTWFWQTYDSEPIGEYTQVTRDYVPSGSGTYYYVNRNRAYYGYTGNEWDNSEKDRQTYYTPYMNEATENTTFEYAPGTYSYMGWYEVYDNGAEADEPYDFSQKTDHDTTLRLRWKQSGNFYLAYDAGNGTLDSSGGAKKDTVGLLTDCYADYSVITMNRVAVAPNGYSFVGWRVKNDTTGAIYNLGQEFTLHADDAVRESGRDVVWLEAVYVGKQTLTLVYDANGGLVMADDVDFGSISGDTIPDDNKSVDAANGTVSVLGLANNSSFTLSSGAGFTRGGKSPVGWSNKPVYDPSDPEAKLYTLGETYGVDINGGNVTTVYAVWGETVTYHLNANDDANATWGGDWTASGFTSTTVGSEQVYTQTAYIGACIDEPGYTRDNQYILYIPTSDSKMFYYWTDLTKGENDEYIPFDFSQPITQQKDLYAVWDGEIEVPVSVLNASEETLTSESAGVLHVRTEAVSLDDLAEHYRPSSAYDYAFAVTLSMDAALSRIHITEADAVSTIYYDQQEKHLYVTYRDSERAKTYLDENTGIFFVYYMEKSLNIGYESMDTSGAMTAIPNEDISTDAPDSTDQLGGSSDYHMEAKVTQPLNWVTDNSAYYAFAIGNYNAENAAGLHFITESKYSDSDRPTLRLRNTWQGIEFTTGTGDDADWLTCGFDLQLYVIYFSQKPTVVMIYEETLGTEAILDTAFEYQIVVEETTEIGGSVTTSQIYNSDSVIDPDTGIETSHVYRLKNGEAQSAVLFYSDDGTTKKTQIVTVTQKNTDDSANFTTTIGNTETKVWTSNPSTAEGGTQSVTFTNKHKALSVEVHVALLEDNGTVRNMDSTLRSVTNSFNLELGKTSNFLDELSSETIFTGEDGIYALGAILYGNETNGVVTVAEMGVNSISYGRVEGSRYELLLNGSTSKLLDEYEIYYLYYRMPRIRYMKLLEDNTLNTIEGASPDAITYDGNPLTMNGVTVEQDQHLLLPVDGVLKISQSGNYFRMPPNLDDGDSVSYLTYTQIAVGAPGIVESSNLAFGSGQNLSLRLQQCMVGNEQKTALEYSFNGNTWTAFDNSAWTTGDRVTPTIYAVYQERGYDLLIDMVVNTSESGAKPIFTQATFNVTIESDAITKDSYEVEGYESATISATPATASEPGRIILENMADGTNIRFKSLNRGEYTITETENENYVLTAKAGSIVSNVLQPITVNDDGSTIDFTLDFEKKLELTNTPRKLCKIVDDGTEHVFYTFADAIEYVENNIVDYTATVEMLSDYLMPAEDVLQIPNEYNITLTTADDGTNTYAGKGNGRAIISRSQSLTGGALIQNEGALTLGTVVLDGENLQATAPLVQSSGVSLTLEAYAELKNAHNTTDGGAIHADAGNITVEGNINNCFAGYKPETEIPEGAIAGRGGAIFYAGSGTVTLQGYSDLNNNTATGDGGAIYAAQGRLILTENTVVYRNTATSGNGGAIYVRDADIEIYQGVSITNNTAQSGGAIYAGTATIIISKTGNAYPTISNNNAVSTEDYSGGGAICINLGSITVTGGRIDGNTAEGNGGAIRAGSAAVSFSEDSTLNNNTATNGGAIYAQSGIVTVSDGSMSGNEATINGGTIYAETGNVLLSNSVVSGSEATGGNGGAVYAGNGSVTVTSCTIGSEDIQETGKPDGNTAINGGAIYAGSGSVTVTDSSFNWNTASEKGGAIYAQNGSVTVTKTESGSMSLSKNKAANSDGGAVYAYSSNVSVNGGTVTGNISGGKGGVIYAASGSVVISEARVTNNIASDDGGVICTGANGSVTVTDCSVVTGNSSTGGDGGVIFTGNGSVTISGSSFGGNDENEGNTAKNGGVVCTDSGTISATGCSMTGNGATDGNGGAICTDSGNVTLSAIALTANTASGNGGALYAESGSVSVTGSSSMVSNSATNGGALYIDSGTANLSSVTMTGNTATENGGAAYAGSGNLTLSGGSMSKNIAGNYGGVAYADSGTLTINSAAKLGNSNYNNANRSKNGAAIYINEGTGVISGDNTAIQYNIATSDDGGAVGVGDSSARLFFSNSVKINNNRQQSSSGAFANVCLNQDSDTVINANGLGGSADIGIYVSGPFDGNLFKNRGAASALFASYTSNSNLGKFKNDRNTGLTAEQADNNKVRWVKKITVEVRYLDTFENGFPPTASGKLLFTLSNYVMPSSENGASQIAADIYANYNNNLLKNVYPDASFACAFKETETEFGNYLTDVNWNGEEGFWQFIPHGWNPNADPAPDPITGSKIIIYFSKSAYLSFVNNTEDSLTLNLTKIEVLSKNAVDDGYGYVTAQNGMTEEKLMPINSDDLTIPAGHSIKFLFPGAANKSFTLEGNFDNSSAPQVTTVKYKVDGTDQTPELPVNFVSTNFAEGLLTLPDNGKTREFLFGEMGLSICKVEEDDTEWPSLMTAMNHIVTLGTQYDKYTIGMLVDYLQPPNDVLIIPDGYDITLTTDEEYSGTGRAGTEKAATLSRDAGNLGAMIISDANTIVNNALHAGFTIENLIMDGRALVGSGDGGALKTKNATVNINNAYFKGFEATNGGALYVDFDTSNTLTHAYQKTEGDYLATMTVTNTDFLNCRSSSNKDKTGGGALWTTARIFTMDHCNVTGSSCYKENGSSNAAQAGAIFHNITEKYSTNTSTYIRNCSFKDCYVYRASGGAVESDALNVVVENCVFDTCYVKTGTKNGGGLNIYANNSENPNVNSSTTIRNTQFINCSSTSNGGAFRTTSEYVTMENVTFSKCKAKNGGAFAATGTNSKVLTINGSSFDSCNADGTGGGGVYTTSNSIIIDDYIADDGTITHSSFTNCQATNEGGGIYQNRDNSSFSMRNAIINGNASTTKAGGGVYTKAKNVTLEGGVISHNTAKTYGGGIYQSKENSFNMTGTTISGNTASDNSGGGIYTVAKVVSLTDGSVSNNTAKQTGGGLYTNAQTSLTIIGTEIKKNTAAGNGGGVWYDYNSDDSIRAKMTLTIKGCSIENNTSGASGGGVFTQVRTVKIGGDDSSVETSISYNTAQNGGGVYHRLFTNAAVSVKNASIDGNKASGTGNNGFGGGLSTNAKTLTITNSSISNNIAVNNGGGVWYDGSATDNSDRKVMSIAISGGSIDGNTSGGSGGGIFTQVKTVEIKDNASVSNNTAATNGGGLYHSLNDEGTKLTVTGGHIAGNKANGTGDNGLGGGVYTNVWTMEAKGVSFANNTAAKCGGGIYDVNWNKDGETFLYPGMILKIQGCSFDGNIASSDSGGGVYTIVGTLTIEEDPSDKTRHTVIQNCSAAGNGGGICHDVYNDTVQTTLTNCTISGCRAGGANGGGGLFTKTGKVIVTNATIKNNTASAGNGGGISYTYDRPADWTENSQDDTKWDISADKGLKLANTTISGNTAREKGGGVYSKSYVWMLHASGITGNHLSSGTVENAAGIYLENNITLIVGDPTYSSDPAANQNDTIYIKENYTNSGADSNLRLWSDSATGLNNAKSVYVHCHLNTASVVRVVNAYTVGTQFGYSNVPNPIGFTQGFTSDSAVFRADHNTLYGIIDRAEGNYQHIIWAGPAICKITDGSGNMLYLRRNSDGVGSDPAIFDRLDTGDADYTGITSAFSVLRGEFDLTNKDGSSAGFTGPELYSANGDPYTGSQYCVKMLDSFTTESSSIIKYHEGRSITLTTASRDPSVEGDYYYEYSKTTKTRGDTAKVLRGSGVGDTNAMIYTQDNLIISNIILDGGSLEDGYTPGTKTRLINATGFNHEIELKLIDGAVLQNAATNRDAGNGGGVYLGKNAKLTIGDEDTSGVIKNCHAPNGGAVYASSESRGIEFLRGSIVQCGAEQNGGGIYQGGGSFTMSGGLIERCTAGRAGGGVFVADNKTFNMTGTGRITGNHAEENGGGIAMGGSGVRLNFSVKPTVKGNTSTVSDAANKACNVQLDYASNNIINTVESEWNGITYKGLANGAGIGVYVSGERDDANPENNGEPYLNHGTERKPFGTYQDGNNEKTFFSFFNDRNGLKGGLIANMNDHLIYWVKIFSLEVRVNGYDVPATGHEIPQNEEFILVVQLTGKAVAEGQLDAEEIEGDEYGDMHFDSNGEDSTTAVVSMKLDENDTWQNGVSCTAENLSAGLSYNITPNLTPDQKKKYVPIPAMYTGTIGENNQPNVDVEESERYISRAPFQYVLAVCKLTNHNGELLYYERDGAKSGEAHIPAVFSSVEDAVAALTEKNFYSGVNYNDSSFIPGIGSSSVQIQMLVETCMLTHTVTIPDGISITMKTASRDAVNEDVYTYRGSLGTMATVKRGFNNGSMFVTEGELTVSNIIFDGNKTTYKGNTIVNENGGIVQVANGGKLTLNHASASLQNSGVKGSGGAVYVASGGTAEILAGKVQMNEAAYGGAVYIENGGKMAMSGGSVENNKYVKNGNNGNGGGIYLADGSTLELSGAPGFGTSLETWGAISTSKGNLGASLAQGPKQTNATKNYPVEHQDIYIEETTEGPSLVLKDNLTGAAGAIWIWAENQERYGMGNAFARVDFDVNSVTEETYHIFRNAQTDARTFVSDTNYLTGDAEHEKDGFIHWTGGYDVIFKKIDGLGNALSGAVFTLYTDPACTSTTVYKRNGADVTATSAIGTEKTSNDVTIDKGLVLIEKIPAGVYYMKETTVPEGYNNEQVYIVLVGQAELSNWGYYGLTQSEITAQTAKYKDDYETKYGVKSVYAIFLYQEGKAVATPDIARYGIMNFSTSERKVILKKVGTSDTPLDGAVFEILRYDGTKITGTDLNGTTTTSFTSGASGVYFIDMLPFGTYYLHETTLPSGYKEKTEGNDGNWFILTVNEDGAGYKQADKTMIQRIAPESTAP